MAQAKAVRLASIQTENGLVSYWEHNEEVYRLHEYEAIQFDIYGLPLGARWETNRFHWDQFKSLFLDPNVSSSAGAANYEASGYPWY